MLPSNMLSNVPLPSGWYYHEDSPAGAGVAYTEGGPSLLNPAEGTLGTTWRVKLKENKYVYLESLTHPETLIHTGVSITWVSLAFDVLMNPLYIWVDQGETFLSWYDAVVADRVITSFGSGLVTPTLDLDAKNPIHSGYADVIFAYLKADMKLYYRQQRERFTVERLLSDGPFVSIVRTGMNKLNRFQFELIPYIEPTGACYVEAYAV